MHLLILIDPSSMTCKILIGWRDHGLELRVPGKGLQKQSLYAIYKTLITNLLSIHEVLILSKIKMLMVNV